MEPIQTKKCKKCEQLKPITDFPKHTTAKYGVGNNCKECGKAISKFYRDNNIEKYREKDRLRDQTDKRKKQRADWETANRDKRREQERTRDAMNRAEVNAKQKAWRENNPEKEKANTLKWREKNRDHLRSKASEYAHVYRSLHPEKVVESTRRYRARLKANGGSYTDNEWIALKEQYGNKCVCCGKHESEALISPDHVIPVSKGGGSDISNIQPLCRRCNAIKSDYCTDYRAGA